MISVRTLLYLFVSSVFYSFASSLSLLQTQGYKGVARDPYSGDVAKVANTLKKELGLGNIDGETSGKGFHASRVQQGVRDLHESSFSLSGRLEDKKEKKTCRFGKNFQNCGSGCGLV